MLGKDNMNPYKRLSGPFSVFVLLLSFVLAPAAASDAQEADKAYVNGNIYTVDEAFSKASAIAVKNGEFIYVGDDAGVQAHVGPITHVVDLDGKTVTPGLHDAHVHIRYGERELYPRTPDIRPSLGEWASVERMQEVIKRCLATGEGMRPGPEPRWLVLRAWMSGVWDPPTFRKELIDAVAPDNPVFISSSPCIVYTEKLGAPDGSQGRHRKPVPSAAPERDPCTHISTIVNVAPMKKLLRGVLL